MKLLDSPKAQLTTVAQSRIKHEQNIMVRIFRPLKNLPFSRRQFKASSYARNAKEDEIKPYLSTERSTETSDDRNINYSANKKESDFIPVVLFLAQLNKVIKNATHKSLKCLYTLNN